MKLNIFRGRAFSKKTLIISGAVLLCLALVAIGLPLLLKSTSSLSDSFEAEVGQEAEVLRDDRGMPLIKASGWRDAFFALGYVHAQDRLIMIEYYRALARGKIGELQELDTSLMDRLASVMDFYGKAGGLLEKLPAPYLEYLEAYAGGINLLKNKKYREIVRFSRLPDDPWSPRDVVAILLFLDWSRSFLANRELVFALPERLGAYRIQDAIPEEMLFWYSDSEQKNIFALRELRREVEKFVGSFDSGFACLFPAPLTHDARTRIAFNLDASMHLYPSWYPVNFQVGDVDLEGVSLAGMPFVFNGRSQAIAFASFALKSDIQDFYIETTRTLKDSQQYLGSSGWRDFETTEVSTAGGETFQVRQSENGPILSDIFGGGYRTDCISIRILQPSADYIAALFDIPFAASPAQARTRLNGLSSAPRAFIFASGETALQVFAGRVPLRIRPVGVMKNRVFNPTLAGMVDLSVYFKAARGELCVIGDSMAEGAPAVLRDSILYNDENRMVRLKKAISRMGGADIGMLQRILRDTHSVSASRYVPLFLRMLEKIPVTSARLTRIYFLDWNYKMRKDSVAATIYQTLLLKLIEETLRDECKNEVNRLLEHHHYFSDAFLKMFEDERSPLFDDISTPDKQERRDEIFDRAFLRAMRYLNEHLGPIMEDWTWGSLHSGRFVVPLVDNGGFWSCLLFKIEDKPVEGGFSTLFRGTSLSTGGLKAGETTCLSGIYDEDSGLYSASYSYSINPFSEYFDYKDEYANFATFKAGDVRYRTVFMPAR